MSIREEIEKGNEFDLHTDMQFLIDTIKAQDLCFDLNQIKQSAREERFAMIRKIVNKIGKDSYIASPFYCSYGYNIEIGKETMLGHECTVLDAAKVSIGDNVLIANGTKIMTSGHSLDKDKRKALISYAYPINIGNNVWIGGGTIILGGVTIGNDSVIGAGSVVTKDIPENVLAAGNPCRVIRKL